MFDSSSRYYRLETVIFTTAGGRQVAYKSRRFLPQVPSAGPLAVHTVKQGERLDHIAAHYLGDPGFFWQLCDVNNAKHPDELIAELGRKIRITLLEVQGI
jgi:hypothetical protein